MIRTFRLAPMSALILGLTWGLWTIPVLFIAAAFLSRSETVLVPLALIMLLLYGAVWLWLRPTRFEVSLTELDMVFPGRRRSISRADITSARVISKQDFRQEFGRPVRIGVGGLWGGFGWLWTGRGLVNFYISRSDGFLLIERATSRPLLITPEKPDRVVEALES